MVWISGSTTRLEARVPNELTSLFVDDIVSALLATWSVRTEKDCIELFRSALLERRRSGSRSELEASGSGLSTRLMISDEVSTECRVSRRCVVESCSGLIGGKFGSRSGVEGVGTSRMDMRV